MSCGVPRMIAVTLAGVAVLAPAAACSSDEPAAGQPPQAADGVPDAAAPTPSPSRPTRSPALPGAARKPVLAVKIENTAAGKPQLGLKSADIVYVEQVEAGLTRLMAVFSSKLPAKVGPVRSARISDLHIVPQFGKPAFAYSGAQTKMLPFIAEASLFDVSDSRRARRLLPRARPLRALQPVRHTRNCSPGAPGATEAKDIGFTFGDAPEGGGREDVHREVPGGPLHLRLVRGRGQVADLAGRQEGHGGRGRPARRAHDRRPVHQDRALPVPRRQRAATRPWCTPSARAGRSCCATARRTRPSGRGRPRRTAPTFTTRAGEPMNFAPGQVWVVLAAAKPVIP